MHKLYLKYTHI